MKYCKNWGGGAIAKVTWLLDVWYHSMWMAVQKPNSIQFERCYFCLCFRLVWRNPWTKDRCSFLSLLRLEKQHIKMILCNYKSCVLHLFLASATVVPCLTTMISSYGTVEQKGTVMGIFRSLGALARAVGPMLASTGKFFLNLSGGIVMVMTKTKSPTPLIVIVYIICSNNFNKVINAEQWNGENILFLS